MKIFLLAAFLLPFTLLAQKKGDTKIVLHDHISYASIKATLFDNGYQLNNDSNYIATSSKELSKYPASLKMMILRTDTSVTFKGYTKLNITMDLGGASVKDDFSLLYFGGSKSSPLRNAWNEMDRIAKLLSENISYAKQ